MAKHQLDWPADPQPHRERTFASRADRDYVQDTLAYYTRIGTLLGAGRHRAGFLVVLDGIERVVKVPLSDAGIEANADEAQRYQAGQPFPAAECRLLPDSPVLSMERVTRLPKKEALAVQDEWESRGIYYHVDRDDSGPQIGVTTDGRAVVFDFGISASEPDETNELSSGWVSESESEVSEASSESAKPLSALTAARWLRLCGL